MYDVSDLFLRTLRVSHAVELRVDAYKAGVLFAEDLPISGGSVSVDSGSQVRRTLRLTIADPSLDPGIDADSTLSPFSTELRVQRGVRYPNGDIEWVPLGWFRLDSVSASTSAQVQVTGVDRAAYVQDSRFLQVEAANTSNTIPTEIARLINAVLPSVTVTDLTGSTATTPAAFWQEDRWGAINELAQSIGGSVYFNPDGNAVIATTPAITNTPVWWVDAGESGVLLDISAESTREGVYNAVVASGEASGDIAPVVATVTDNDPASPTYWLGPFGQKPRFYVSPFITTTAQATSAATSLLNRVRGLSRQLRLSMLTNPALEAGDVIRIRFPDGSTEAHLIDSVDVPLDAESASSLSTRSPDPAKE